MTRLPWRDLASELQAWDRDGRVLRIWWRDDDAIAPTSQLDRLVTVSEQHRVPVHLAIIPKLMQPALPAHLSGIPTLRPAVHGWAHVNHEPAGNKSAEFGAGNASAINDAQRGFDTLRAAFGAALVPVFVPPWNRIAPDVITALPGTGAAILSTYGPRKSQVPAPGLEQINTHVDPVDWRGTRGLSDPAIQISKLIALLKDRRLGRADDAEPLGLLTHHLMQDEATWDFCSDLLEALIDGGAAVAELA